MRTEPTPSDLGPPPAPNHHASHPGFSGASGLLAALSFLVGRTDAADLAIELSDLQPGERVVDVGCGPGVAVRRAVEHGADAIGVDPAPVMLRVARARWARLERADWRIGTAESVPVDDDRADVVWSLATVHHWADIDAGIAEAKRVLAPGGRLVVLERRIADPDARGHASHGWTTEQAESFAAMCRRQGFVAVGVGTHTDRSTLLSVVARRPAG